MALAKKYRVFALGSLFAVAMFAMAACGGGDDPTATATATNEPEATSTTEATATPDNSLPGEGVTVQAARATWDTGYFNEALFSRALEELGYTVEDPLELDNPIFYQQVALGEVDYWANGWFPGHNQYSDVFGDGAEIIGTIVPGGALQGYLIDKAGAEEFGITTLADFARPEVREAYDTDGNGKANMVACPEGWGCNGIVGYHFEDLGLGEFIDQGTAGYALAMADAMARYQNGEHILFYTWTPNWTVNELVPGEDVVWIGLEEPSHPEDLSEEALTANGLEGAVTDSLIMGFPPNDIQVVANSEFLDNNPAAAALFEAMELTLGDIAQQNAQMQDGENSQEDIEQHATEWIAANQETWDAWIQAALDAA